MAPLVVCLGSLTVFNARQDAASWRSGRLLGEYDEIGCRRRVYLDLGVNWANTLRLYETLVPDEARFAWEIYGFEASPLIQPYANAFCDWLNGKLPTEPLLCLPRAGSTSHLTKYADLVGCPRDKRKVRTCMNDIFDTHLRALQPERALNSSNLIAERARVALQPIQCGTNSSRFTFLPAAVGVKTGLMTLESAPHRLIRGGSVARSSLLTTSASSETALREAMRSAWYHEKDYVYEVQVFDVASWMAKSFSVSDMVVVKMDIEGAEFSVIRKLIALGKLELIDVLAMECHGSSVVCAQLVSEVQAATAKRGFRMVKEAAYDGIDRYSQPPTGNRADWWLRACNIRVGHPE